MTAEPLRPASSGNRIRGTEASGGDPPGGGGVGK
jgi:hypothetical protein